MELVGFLISWDTVAFIKLRIFFWPLTTSYMIWPDISMIYKILILPN